MHQVEHNLAISNWNLPTSHQETIHTKEHTNTYKYVLLHTFTCIYIPTHLQYIPIHLHTYQYTRVPKYTRPPISAPRALMGQLSFLYALSAVGYTAPESGRPKDAECCLPQGNGPRKQESARWRSPCASTWPLSHAQLLPTVWYIHLRPQRNLRQAGAHAAARPEVTATGCKSMYQHVSVKHIKTYEQIHTQYMYQYIPIPPVLSCTSIDRYHDVFAFENIRIHAIIRTNTTGARPKPVC